MGLLRISLDLWVSYCYEPDDGSVVDSCCIRVYEFLSNTGNSWYSKSPPPPLSQKREYLFFNPFTQASLTLSACIFSLHYPHKIGCLVMRIKQLMIHTKLSKMKSKFSQLAIVCMLYKYSQLVYKELKREFSRIQQDDVRRCLSF